MPGISELRTTRAATVVEEPVRVRAAPRRRARPRLSQAARQELLWITVMYLAARGLLLLVAYLNGTFGHHNFLHELANWDGLWYRSLANHGYPHHVVLRPDEPRLLPAVPAGHLRGRAAAAADHQPRRGLVRHRRRGAHLRRRRAGGDRHGPPPRRGLVGPRHRAPGDDPVHRLPGLGGVLDGLLRGSAAAPRRRLHLRAGAAPLGAGRHPGRVRHGGAAGGAGPGAGVRVLGAARVASVGLVGAPGPPRPSWRRCSRSPALGAFMAFLWAWTGNPLATYIAQHHGWSETTTPLSLWRMAEKLADEIDFSHFNQPTINLNLVIGLIGGVTLRCGSSWSTSPGARSPPRRSCGPWPSRSSPSPPPMCPRCRGC